MSDIVRIVLAILACHRLTELFLYDDGPFGIFLKLRDLVGANASDDWDNLSELGKLFSCPYCLGVWAAAVCALAFAVNKKAARLFLIWMGIAGAQSIITGKRQ